MFNNQVIAGSSGQGGGFYDFPLEQSLRFNDDDSAYLSWTPASVGNRKTWTWSGWIKRSTLGTKQSFFCATAGNYNLQFFTDNKLKFEGAFGAVVTDAVFRDVSAFYHIVAVHDTTEATSSNRFKIYVNGVQQTLSGTYPSGDGVINNTVEHGIGGQSSANFFDGYLAEVNFIDGQALDPTSFGETKSGIWIPKDPTGLTYGTNGFRLNFADTVTASGFNTVTYTGNGGTQAVNGVGFSSTPDFVWIKQRSSPADNHRLFNSVVGATKYLVSDDTFTETTDANTLTSFDNDGFSLGSSGIVNESGKQFVAWCWDAGSGSPVSNTDGSITSTVKANTDYGFSIATFTGTGANATVGHGLGQTPDAVIVKQRSAAGNHWVVWTNALSGTQFLYLDSAGTTNTNAGIWNSTTPTSSVFSVGSDAQTNGSGNNLVAYCFAEKTGFSKISTYNGTGVSGNSITTGFRPAFIMIKRTDAAFGWYMYDTTRQVQNPMGSQTDPLVADTPNAEGGADPSWYIDVTDTGFTINNTSLFDNASGGSYIYMAFADTRDAAFWRDVSGQGNDWQPNNLTFSDVVPDAPSNNFAVVPSTTLPSTGYSQHTEGNLQLYQPSWGGWDINLANFHLPSSGKYYWEIMPVQGIFNAGFGAFIFGIGNIRGRENISGFPTFGNPLVQVDSRGIGEYRQYPSWVDYTKSGNFGFTVGSTVYGIAVDCDNKKFWFSLNNSWAGTSGTTLTAGTGDPANGTNGDPISGDMTDYVPFFNVGDQQSSCRLGINFGQDSTFAGARAAGGNADENGYGDFAYAPPSGFLSLCSANLPKGAIDTLADETPEDYFKTVLWTGDATNPRTLTGVGFEPSFSWLKSRSQAFSHRLYDAVRGAGNVLFSNAASAESSGDAGGELSAFTSDGFTTSGSSNNNNLNGNGYTYVGWNWKAGGAGVSNTDGSITSTVSVGATSQQNWFSVVGYTGTGSTATVGHGLNVQPDAIIIKDRSSGAYNWNAWFNSFTGSQVIYPNLTNFKNNDPNVWAGTLPTSSVFTVNNVEVNSSSNNYIAYCFANAENLCKVGTYVGNGSTDGSFIYTGFRPSAIIAKNTNDGTTNWWFHDDKRLGYNANNYALFPNLSIAEDANVRIDMLSNGFKLRNTAKHWNTSGQTFIYLAIASQPFKYANAR